MFDADFPERSAGVGIGVSVLRGDVLRVVTGIRQSFAKMERRTT